MKRIYIKPEIRTLQLHMKAFITAGSGPGPNNGTEWNMGEEPIGTGGSDDLSRSWGKKMWEDME